jgi:D-erythronate 2-dehydrogenase
MKVLVTGGAGFLGQKLIAALLARGSMVVDDSGRASAITRVLSLDVGAGVLTDPRLEYRSGNIANPAQVRTLVDADTRLIVHLAAIVSGTAEADFELGMQVNLDGTRNLLEAARAAGQQPRLLFSSSIAVFGGNLPAIVTDSTMPTPQGSYGIQKYIGEQLVQDFTRKGFIDGRSVRIPTVVVRPGKPNGAASGFASNIIREPLSGIAVPLPVDPSTEMWIASPRAVVRMLLHAIETPTSTWGWYRAINLPGFVVSMNQEISTLRKFAGDEAVRLIQPALDEKVMTLVKTWAAHFDTSRANEMGFVADKNVDEVVRGYIEDNRAAVKLDVRL